MDKEKQIEDKKQLISILRNSKDIVSYQPNAREIPFWGSDKRKFFIQDDNGHLTIHFDKIVDEIYKQGYRKIEEGSVVLSKEEGEELNDTIRGALKREEKWRKLCDIKAKEIEAARKQAVKEFAERLKENFRKNNIESGIWFTNVSIVDKTSEEFGVEL